jgi:very-short-patch-repair endonuclease
MIKERICPFCNKIMVKNGTNHIYKCGSCDTNLSKEDKRIAYIRYNFPEIFEENNLYTDYIINEYSLTMLKDKYGLDYKGIYSVMKFLCIDKKPSEIWANEGIKKSNLSNMRLYGVKNASQRPEIKEKVKETFMKHYGVDNIRKSKEFYEYIEHIMHIRYGMSRKEYLSKKGKEAWEKLTDEEKENWLNRSIFSPDRKHNKSSGYFSSKIESLICNALSDYKIDFIQQMIIRYGKGHSRKHYLYDIYIKKYNLIIEINGDFWHANPNKYKETDKLNLPSGMITAKEIWNKDSEKKSMAIEYGYNIIEIWESEIKLKNNEQLIKMVYEKYRDLQNSKN